MHVKKRTYARLSHSLIFLIKSSVIQEGKIKANKMFFNCISSTDAIISWLDGLVLSPGNACIRSQGDNFAAQD